MGKHNIFTFISAVHSGIRFFFIAVGLPYSATFFVVKMLYAFYVCCIYSSALKTRFFFIDRGLVRLLTICILIKSSNWFGTNLLMT